jgi:hypothetical protein
MEYASEPTLTGAHGADPPDTLAVADGMTWPPSRYIAVIKDGNGE